MDIEEQKFHPGTGMPRWMIWAFLGKLALVTAITVAVVWYASR